MSAPAPAPAFASMSEAMAMARAAQDYLAAADPAAMTPQAQAEYLRAQEQHDAISTATRARILAAFTAARGYTADADYSPTSWLIHQTRITKAAARAHLAWSRRADSHPKVVSALAEGDVVTELDGPGHLRVDRQDPGLVPGRRRPDPHRRRPGRGPAAGPGRAGRRDLRPLPARRPGRRRAAFRGPPGRAGDHPGGAGLINGDLTAECAAVVTAVLESLSAPRGAEDTRTREQRYHDALEEAMTRLIAAGLLPDRAGQPVKAMVHVSLPELRAMDGGSVLQDEWITAVRAKWAAHRAAASVTGSDGGAWLDGPAARGMTCDASVIPVVTGEVDVTVLDELVRLCVLLDRLDHQGDRAEPAPGADQTPAAADDPGPEPGGQAREMLQHAIIGRAVDLVSGPGGLASFLRPEPARRPAGRPLPAAGRRPQRGHPGRDPPRGHPARPALPLGRRLRPARRRRARCTT